MRGGSTHFVLLLALLLGGLSSYGQDPLGAKPKKPRAPEDYEPRTLKEVATTGSDAGSRGNKEETMVVYGAVLPSRVRATYAGSARRLPRIKKEVLRQWARLYAGSPEGYTEPYETEVLFVEGGTKYWLAVRRESLRRFGREVKGGEQVDLYLIRVGAARASAGWESVVLVERFQKPRRAEQAGAVTK